MDNFLIVAGQVAILFVLMGVGMALRKAKLLNDAALDGMINLLILVVTPCLIIDVFQRPFSPDMLRGLALAFVLSVAIHLASIVGARLCVRQRDENVRRPLLLAAVFSNAGFIGIPLEQAVLGDGGVFYGIVYIAVFNLFMWSWGLRTMCGAGGPAAGHMRIKMFVNPGTVGLAVGFPFFVLSQKLPAIVGTPVHLIAGLNTPLALIIVGYCLSGARFDKVMRTPAVYVTAFVRLLAFPLLAVAALYPLRACVDRNMLLAVTIAIAAPVAAMVPMFAAKFGRDVDASVAVVSGTTLLSILTMPTVIALAMSVL